MTLNGHFALCFKIHAFSEHTTKIWMKIDPYYQRKRCSAMTVVSGNIRFMRTFARVPCRRGVKRQWGNRKRRFSWNYAKIQCLYDTSLNEYRNTNLQITLEADIAKKLHETGQFANYFVKRDWFSCRPNVRSLTIYEPIIGVDPARVQGSGSSQKLYCEGPQRMGPS